MKRIRSHAVLVPLLTWSVGMVMVFGPIVFSGMRRTFFGLGDVRLVNFTLEHSYRWLSGHPLHADFWSPPLFYPQENVAAYTDLLLGAAVPYWLVRAGGLPPVPSFLSWVLFNWTLNFVAAFLLFRRLFGVEIIGASLGAFLFAFGNPRSADVPHQQLQPAFYLLTAFAALLLVFGETDLADRCRRGWIVAFFAMLVAQAYTAFYPLYFFGLCVLVAALWALALPDTRRRFRVRLRQNAWTIGASGLAALVALLPLLNRYVRAAGEVGLRGYPWDALPRPVSWLLMGPRHPLYGWLQRRDGPFFELRQTHHSHGVGPVTTALALIGIYWAWKRRSVRLLALVVGSLVVLTTLYPGGYSGWRLIYEYLPGAAALRAVGRIGMIALLPLSLGAAMFFGRLQRQGRWVLMAVLAAVMVAEQSHDLRFRDRRAVEDYVASLAAQVDPECTAFLLLHVDERPYPHVHDDAAWVTLATGVPTVNGRYGNLPPEYGLRDVQAINERDRESVGRELGYWIERHGLDETRVCTIETRGLDR